MNLMPAGRVEEILAGGGSAKDDVRRFLKQGHFTESRNGVSYAAIGVLDCGMVWLLTGDDPDELAEALRDADAVDAEVIELTNLQ